MTKISKKIGKMWKDMTGVSPIIAVILMVAITVVLAATIYVWVSGFGGSGGTSAAISMRQTNFVEGTSENNVTYQVLNAKGGLGWEDIKITVGGTEVWDGSDTTPDKSSGGVTISSGGETDAEEGKIAAGDTITIYDDAVTHGATVTIIDISSDTPIWSAAITY